MSGPSHTPVRTCVGCRSRGSAAELVRLALVDGRVTVDVRRRLPGRGASIHARRGCIEAAVGRGAFGRAFRTRVQVPAVDGLWQDMTINAGAQVGLCPPEPVAGGQDMTIGSSDISASGRTTT